MSDKKIIKLLGQPRIFFSMARDGLLPAWFARVHPRFRTPHVTTIVTGLAVGLASMVTTLEEMVDLTNIGTLFAFILVCIGIIVLRIKEPEQKGSFRVPGGVIIPALYRVSDSSIICLLYLMASICRLAQCGIGDLCLLWLGPQKAHRAHCC